MATETFWEDYVGGVLVPIAEFLEHSPTHPAAVSILELAPHTTPTPYLAFAIERLFSTKLVHSPQYHRAPMLLDPEKHCLTAFERDLLRYTRPRVEAALLAGKVDDELASLLDFVATMRVRYSRLYFQHYPHPYTGKFIPRLALPGLDDQGVPAEESLFGSGWSSV